MSKPTKAVATNVSERTGMRLSGEQAKQRIYSQGITLREFARRNSLNYRTVSEVLRGVNQGLYGEGHRAAVALGMK